MENINILNVSRKMLFDECFYNYILWRWNALFHIIISNEDIKNMRAIDKVCEMALCSYSEFLKKNGWKSYNSMMKAIKIDGMYIDDNGFLVDDCMNEDEDFGDFDDEEE